MKYKCPFSSGSVALLTGQPGTRHGQSARAGPAAGHIAVQPGTSRFDHKPTYHLIIDFVEMNFTDFFHHVFIFKSYEAKSCLVKKQRGEGGRKMLVKLKRSHFSKASLGHWDFGKL